MSARDEILGRIGAALGRDAAITSLDDAKLPDAVRQRLAGHPRSTLPALGGERIARLIERMEAVLMSVQRLQHDNDIVEAVRFWLEEHGQEGDVTVAPALAHLDWPEDYRVGAASGTEQSAVTPCLAAIAETGSIALASTASTPSQLNFLPENHLVVLREGQVVDHLDDLWDRLRRLSVLPRATNLVTGPSRTADIEQTLEIGAHGPRRMHVLLLPGE